MKKTFLTLILLSLTLITNAQNSMAENSTSGIQIGTLGIWIHNEYKLPNSLILRTELGFDSAIWGGSYSENTGFIMALVVTAEPRWYYNLNKRNSNSKRIDGNSGNFLSLKTSFHPDWLVISNTENVDIINDITIIPTWGIKRNIGKYFNYEAGIGIGYRHILENQNELFVDDYNKLAGNLHLRFGYRF